MALLFSRMKIGNLEIKNRFVHSATYECMATAHGQVTDQMVKRYESLAKGEVGLIIPGYMFIQPSGRASGNQTGIHSDEMIPGLKRIAEAIHENGGKTVFQLVHAGRSTTKAVCGETPMGPSGKDRDPVNFVKPREMNEEDIQGVIRGFGGAAVRALEAGADGVQIHGAHGFLVNQFLSPFFNKRKDAWGGSDENRFRFLKEVLLEIRKSVPEGTPILTKLNTNDHTPRQGITPDLAKFYAEELAKLGIDAVEISSGAGLYSFMNTCRGQVPVDELVASVPMWQRPIARIMMNRLKGKYDLEEPYHLEAAKIIKPVLGETPLILVGGMRKVSRMEEVLQNKETDFISMSRPFIREPYLVRKIKDGKTDKASCVSCNKCFGSITGEAPLKCYHKAS